jgi:hypothetical protein
MGLIFFTLRSGVKSNAILDFGGYCYLDLKAAQPEPGAARV